MTHPAPSLTNFFPTFLTLSALRAVHEVGIIATPSPIIFSSGIPIHLTHIHTHTLLHHNTAYPLVANLSTSSLLRSHSHLPESVPARGARTTKCIVSCSTLGAFVQICCCMGYYLRVVDAAHYGGSIALQNHGFSCSSVSGAGWAHREALCLTRERCIQPTRFRSLLTFPGRRLARVFGTVDV